MIAPKLTNWSTTFTKPMVSQKNKNYQAADMLIYTDLHGIESHGVQRLVMYDNFIQNGKIRVQSAPEIVKKQTSVPL